MRRGWVYILCGRTGTLYTGVTSNLYNRVLEHRSVSNPASSQNIVAIVWFILKSSATSLRP
ncbi:GIY-YIG nuclease family protein [Acidobacterium sp. S8]|uniref:GIY-YIG nuclease family protein n=1 Tax=Acidobacterium sp. S8 TaxID=1641854 RepID=UPI0020B15476|nr:GIY-YIG nuclease family protein [Acidobacterium sp. S8]